MTKQTPLTFTVSGKGTFPLDMLRYDQCWPKTPKDADEIKTEGEAHRTARTITLQTWKDEPTTSRWSSYGWEVAEPTGYVQPTQPPKAANQRPT